MQTGGAPIVSVIVSVIAAGRQPPPAVVRLAIGSVLRQTLAAVEVIVDAPGFEDLGPRIRRGSVADARGRWLCWLGGGDMMHPRRLQDLVQLAEADGCGIVADTMLTFRQGRAPQPSLPAFAGSLLVGADRYASRFAGRVRPLIRAALPGAGGADPLPRLLADGATFRVYPHVTYFSGKAAVPGRSGRRIVAVISRQRLTGRSSGSSAYLLSLCQALRDAGLTVRLIIPSPATFGRWPAFRLGAEMGVFSRISMRGAWRIGPFLVARDPRIALRTGAAVLGCVLAATGLTRRWLTAPAPYAIGLPVSRADRLFVARQLWADADFLLVDYAFLTDLIAYGPAVASMVVMHDLFSSRPVQFARIGHQDSTVIVAEDAEMAMLSLASFVLAIQPDEAAIVAQRLSTARILTAPMAVVSLPQPQPGTAGLLFVASAASPNVDGLRWFLSQIWPSIRQTAPGVVLTVIGAVGAKISAPPGVAVAGRVADLAPAYRDAAIVIAPLRAGSGLKIKLIEAMGQGKAIVATSVAVQGVEAVTREAVLVADQPDDFARAVVSLLQDPARRTRYAAAAAAVARAHFSPAACYGEAIAQVVSAINEQAPS